MNYPFQMKAATHRKVFVSFHHADQWYRDRWDELFGSIFISKSVGEGEIDDTNSAEYVARVIRQEYMTDASVCVVLIGPNTYCRKHVDWEIAAALDPRTGGRAGLVGLYLPNHLGYYGSVSGFIPARLEDNVKSGYAKLYRWTGDAAEVEAIVEEAFANRRTLTHLARNGRTQFGRNLC